MARTNRGNGQGTATPRRRLSGREREALIVQEAIRFFAEVGFEGQTRELARRLGVTQPLLFRYFPTKDALIERVYEELFLRRWNPQWEAAIGDRTVPLRERLIRYYCDYSRTIFTYEWVRIFMFAGLRGLDINRRYLKLVRERVFVRVCTEMRHVFDLPGPDSVPISDREIELAWGLHSSVFYLGVRQHIYGAPAATDRGSIIEELVDTYLGGLATALAPLVDRAAALGQDNALEPGPRQSVSGR